MTVVGEEFKAALGRVALDQGAVAFGVTEAAPVADHARFVRWLRQGRHGSMEYLRRDADVRADPRRLLPDARSVLCIAVPYPAPAFAPAPSPTPSGPGPSSAAVNPPPAGRLAALFGGTDYHRVVHAALGAIAAEGKRLGGPSTAWLPAVDTLPLLERSLAMQAGLGVVGKNTQLLVPGHGSLVCLGVLVTSVPLPPDAPTAEDPCGACDACQRACPTGALGGDEGVLAPRCLSSLTTAFRDAIPEELRPLVGARVYGCDECQTACPWNHPARLAAHVPHPDLVGDTRVDRATLEAWLGTSGRQLRRSLAGTALAHLGAPALRRTASVVLGNLGDRRSLPALRQAALHRRDHLLRDHATWALARLARD